MRRQVFVKEQHVSAEEEYDQFEEIAKHVVIYDIDIPVGAGRLRMVDGIGKIERICVLPSYRKKELENSLWMHAKHMPRKKQYQNSNFMRKHMRNLSIKD